MGFSLSEPYPLIFTGVLLAYTLFVYVLLTTAMWQGQPWLAALWVWLASLVPVYCVAAFIERRPIKITEFSSQSWAFLFGDIIVLPLMAMALAKAWQYMPAMHTSAWWQSWVWRVFCLAMGVGAGTAFHLMDRVNYEPLAWNSPSKLTHEFCAFVVLFGGLLFGLIPAALSANAGSGWYVVAAVVCLLAWVALGVADNTVHHLDGRNLHVLFDWLGFRSIPYSPR